MSARTLKMSNICMGKSCSSMPLIGMIRCLRMSWVDSSLCSVSYQSTRNFSVPMRSTDSTSSRKHNVIKILLIKVLPLLAFPEKATSSPLGKQGLWNSLNRNSIFWSSFSGVIRRFSRCVIIFSVSGERPALASSPTIWLKAPWFILLFLGFST